MFTGLIQDVGTVLRVEKRGRNLLLGIRTGLDLEEVALGDSICINGFCQTVVKKEGDAFFVEVSPETVSVTTAAELRPGQKVNLEPALRLSDRLGGHLVAGHVDETGVIGSIDEGSDFVVISIKAGPEMLKYCILKGSIAVEGVSLTINKVLADRFEVGIIPHTLKMTTLGDKGPGDRVNLEADLIGRYVGMFVSNLIGNDTSDAKVEGQKIDATFLAKHGFLK